MTRGITLMSLLALVVLSGCGADRKFLQMDSNSRSPFMGLEFKVDADRSLDRFRALAAADALPRYSDRDMLASHSAHVTFRAQNE